MSVTLQADLFSPCLSEIKFIICRHLGPRDGLALFAVSKEWAKWDKVPEFWHYRLIVDFALYAGEEVPPAELLNSRVIGRINEIYQKYDVISPVTPANSTDLYEPLPKNTLRTDFDLIYKQKLIHFIEHPELINSCSFVLLKKKNSFKDSVGLYRGSYSLLACIEAYGRERHLQTVFRALETTIKDCGVEKLRQRRNKKLRIFMYFLGSIAFVIAALKLSGLILSRLKAKDS